MNKKLKLALIGVAIIAIVGAGIQYYINHGGERNISSEDSAFKVTSKSISDEFAGGMDAANKKYLEKAIEISGKITSVSSTAVTIDNNIICNLSEPDASLKNNQTVSAKGRVVGYDELMGELKLDQCTIIKN